MDVAIHGDGELEFDNQGRFKTQTVSSREQEPRHSRKVNRRERHGLLAESTKVQDARRFSDSRPLFSRE